VNKDSGDKNKQNLDCRNPDDAIRPSRLLAMVLAIAVLMAGPPIHAIGIDAFGNKDASKLPRAGL
jgi:hypothetical protein